MSGSDPSILTPNPGSNAPPMTEPDPPPPTQGDPEGDPETEEPEAVATDPSTEVVSDQPVVSAGDPDELALPEPHPLLTGEGPMAMKDWVRKEIELFFGLGHSEETRKVLNP